MNAAILLALMPLVEQLIAMIVYLASLSYRPQSLKCSFGKFSIEMKFATNASKPR